MLNIIKSWLSSHLLRLIGWGVAGLSVLTVLLGARQAGPNAERNDQLKKIIEVKDAQLPATLDAPRTRNELIDRLRGANSNPVTACPPIKEYSREFQNKLADEIESAPKDAVWPLLVQDYALVRRQARFR